jgi:hypothetical protein
VRQGTFAVSNRADSAASVFQGRGAGDVGFSLEQLEAAAGRALLTVSPPSTARLNGIRRPDDGDQKLARRPEHRPVARVA